MVRIRDRIRASLTIQAGKFCDSTSVVLFRVAEQFVVFGATIPKQRSAVGTISRVMQIYFPPIRCSDSGLKLFQ